MLNIYNNKILLFGIIIILFLFFKNISYEKMSNDKPLLVEKKKDKLIFYYPNKKTIVFKNNNDMVSKTIYANDEPSDKISVVKKNNRYKNGPIEIIKKIGKGLNLKEQEFYSLKQFKNNINITFNKKVEDYFKTIKNKKIKIIIKYNVKNTIEIIKIEELTRTITIDVGDIDKVEDDVINIPPLPKKKTKKVKKNTKKSKKKN